MASAKAQERVMQYKAAKEGTQCKRHPDDPAVFFCVSCVEVCCQRCREVGEAHFYHECVCAKTAASQAKIRVEDKVAELKRMDLAVARLVDVLTKKTHHIKQNAKIMEADIRTKMEHLAMVIGMRKTELIQNARQTETYKVNTLARAMKEFRDFRKWCTMLPEEANAALANSQSKIRAGYALMTQLPMVEARIDQAIALIDDKQREMPAEVLSAPRAKEIVLEYSGDVPAEYSYALDISEVAPMVQCLDFQTHEEIASIDREALVKSKFRAVGADTEDYRPRNMVGEEAAATEFKRVQKERNEWEDRCYSLESELEETKSQLATARLQMQNMASPSPTRSSAMSPSRMASELSNNKQMSLLVEATRERDALRNELAQLKGELRVVDGDNHLHVTLSKENSRLRDSLNKARVAARGSANSFDQALAEADADLGSKAHELEMQHAAAAEARMANRAAERQVKALEDKLGQERIQSKATLIKMSEEWKRAQQVEVEKAQVAASQAESRAARAKQRVAEMQAVQEQQSKYIHMLDAEMKMMRGQLEDSRNALRRHNDIDNFNRQ